MIVVDRHTPDRAPYYSVDTSAGVVWLKEPPPAQGASQLLWVRKRAREMARWASTERRKIADTGAELARQLSAVDRASEDALEQISRLAERLDEADDDRVALEFRARLWDQGVQGEVIRQAWHHPTLGFACLEDAKSFLAAKFADVSYSPELMRGSAVYTELAEHGFSSADIQALYQAALDHTGKARLFRMREVTEAVNFTGATSGFPTSS